MKRIIIATMLGMCIFTLVSCGNKVVNEDELTNKYPIEEYLDKGATLEHYFEDGSAKLLDTQKAEFFVGDYSTYKVILTDDGVILPYIVVNDMAYYFDSEISKDKAPSDLDKAGRVNTFGGTLEGLSDDSNAAFTFINSLSVYSEKDDNSVIYTQYSKEEDGYQVWKSYDSIKK